MASYVVRIWDLDSITKERETTHRTSPAAFNAFELAVYDVLAAFGKLDTQAAYFAMEAARKAQDIMQVGEDRGVTVSNTGKSVKILRVA